MNNISLNVNISIHYLIGDCKQQMKRQIIKLRGSFTTRHRAILSNNILTLFPHKDIFLFGG